PARKPMPLATEPATREVSDGSPREAASDTNMAAPTHTSVLVRSPAGCCPNSRSTPRATPSPRAVPTLAEKRRISGRSVMSEPGPEAQVPHQSRPIRGQGEPRGSPVPHGVRLRRLQQLVHLILDGVGPDLVALFAQVQVVGHDRLWQVPLLVEELAADVE